MEKQERKERKILTDNRMTTVNKRETSFEGLVSQFENGEDGILVPERNTLLLEQAIEKLILDECLWQRFSNAAKYNIKRFLPYRIIRPEMLDDIKLELRQRKALYLYNKIRTYRMLTWWD